MSPRLQGSARPSGTWLPTNTLLKHGRERILYGIPLVANVRDYSLGVDEADLPARPEPADNGEAVARVVVRALGDGVRPGYVQESMQANRLVRPVRHGARVPIPSEDEALPIGVPRTVRKSKGLLVHYENLGPLAHCGDERLLRLDPPPGEHRGFRISRSIGTAYDGVGVRNNTWRWSSLPGARSS